MKRTFTNLLALACIVIGTTASAQVLTPELIYYDFNSSGTTVPNLASSPVTPSGTILGTGMSQGGSAICEGTLIGTGTNGGTDYVNTGWAPNLGNGAWTLSFRTANIVPSSTLWYIFGDNNSGSWRCFTNGVAGPNNWILRGPHTDISIPNGAVTASTMNTFVYDPVAGQLRSYLNGVLVSTVTQAAININGSGPLKVGAYATNSNLNGNMDEFRLYSRALTQAEITELNNPWTATSFLGIDFTGCSATAVPVELPNWPWGSVLWSNGATTDSTAVSTSGTIYVDVTGNCGTGTDTIMVTIAQPTAATTAVVTCDMDYTTPSGNTLTTSGTYMDTITNVAGCDSVITINYTRNMPSTSTIAVTACVMYTAPSGQMIMSTGTYMDTIANAVGCDSVITINAVINQPSSASISPTVCNSYTAPSGAMYTMSGMYMDTISNMAGCDSVITINLTVNMASSATITQSVCGWYVDPSGDTLMASGTYMDTIPNMAGCDSVITINLTVNNATASSMNASACGSYTAPSGAVYTMSGTFMDTIANMAGCDSVITISLTVTTVTAGATVAGQVCTATGTTAGASFQWFDCNGMTPINGATAINYTATANGSYCVVMTIGNCTDTSSCVSVTGIGIEENAFASSISLYPNPNSGEFNINLGATYNDVTVIITDVAGRVVFTQSANGTNMIPVSLDAPAGAYVITVIAGNEQANIRMIKE